MVLPGRGVGVERSGLGRGSLTNRRFVGCLAVAVMAAASGCADRSSAPEQRPEGVRVVGVRAVYDVPFGAYVAPDGSAWIYDDGDQLCGGRHAELEAAPRCAPWDRSLSKSGVSWSSDATRVVFTEEPELIYYDTDVSVFDIETGRIEVLTEDDSRDSREPAADVDVLPFFGPGDEIYFFRAEYGFEDLALYRLTGGKREPVDGGRLGDRFPSGPPLASDEDTWTFAYEDGYTPVRFSRPVGYAELAFGGSDTDPTVSLKDLWAPTDDQRSLADAAGGALLLVPPSSELLGPDGVSIVVPERRASVPLVVGDPADGLTFLPSGAGTLSPEGDRALEIDSSSNDVRFAVWYLDMDGDTVGVERSDAGAVSNERVGVGFGFTPGSVGWDGGTTLTAAGTEGVVVFDVTSG